MTGTFSEGSQVLPHCHVCSLGLISGGILIYLFIVENFDVFQVYDQHGDQPSASPALKTWPCFSLSRLPTGYIRSIV